MDNGKPSELCLASKSSCSSVVEPSLGVNTKPVTLETTRVEINPLTKNLSNIISSEKYSNKQYNELNKYSKKIVNSVETMKQ